LTIHHVADIVCFIEWHRAFAGSGYFDTSEGTGAAGDGEMFPYVSFTIAID